jgi:hypothetical protein
VSRAEFDQRVQISEALPCHIRSLGSHYILTTANKVTV